MAKTLDFNLFNQPTLPLVMCDAEHTPFTVTVPTEELVEELEALAPNLNTIFKSDNPTAHDAVYKLAAKFISCNLEGLQVTAEELKTKYWPKSRLTNQLYLLRFFSAYLDFINEIKEAKN